MLGSFFDIQEIMETFSTIIKGEKTVLVDFFAEWCGPCKMMAPELKRFAESKKDNLRVLKVDIDKNRQTASEFNIQGVPTLILFKQDKGSVAAIRCHDGSPARRYGWLKIVIAYSLIRGDTSFKAPPFPLR